MCRSLHASSFFAFGNKGRPCNLRCRSVTVYQIPDSAQDMSVLRISVYANCDRRLERWRRVRTRGTENADDAKNETSLGADV